MTEDRDPGAVRVFGQCWLCEEAGHPPVAVCRCCGAFVCREHAVQLVYPPLRQPVGVVVPQRPREKGIRVKMVCEVCHLNGLAVREEAV